MPSNIDKFSDIRPYNDEEIQPAIKRVINSEEFIDAILSFRFSKLSKFLGFVLKPLIRRYFLYKWGNIDSIDINTVVSKLYKGNVICAFYKV